MKTQNYQMSDGISFKELNDATREEAEKWFFSEAYGWFDESLIRVSWDSREMYETNDHKTGLPMLYPLDNVGNREQAIMVAFHESTIDKD